MANVVNIQLLENGPRNAMIAVYMRSDGATGDLASYPLLVPAAAVAANPYAGGLGMDKNARLRLGRVEYNFSGFDAVLSFGSGTIPPNYKWVLTEGANCPVDFTCWTNLFDNSGMDGTEILAISTTGFTNSNDQGSILIQVIK